MLVCFAAISHEVGSQDTRRRPDCARDRTQEYSQKNVEEASSSASPQADSCFSFMGLNFTIPWLPATTNLKAGRYKRNVFLYPTAVSKQFLEVGLKCPQGWWQCLETAGVPWPSHILQAASSHGSFVLLSSSNLVLYPAVQSPDPLGSPQMLLLCCFLSAALCKDLYFLFQKD